MPTCTSPVYQYGANMYQFSVPIWCQHATVQCTKMVQTCTRLSVYQWSQDHMGRTCFATTYCSQDDNKLRRTTMIKYTVNHSSLLINSEHSSLKLEVPQPQLLEMFQNVSGFLRICPENGRSIAQVPSDTADNVEQSLNRTRGYWFCPYGTLEWNFWN